MTNEDDAVLQIDESNFESISDLTEDHPLSIREEIDPPQVVVQQASTTEAYCHLCERSFCNKYFLKTHLAKKHGVINTVSPRSSSTENNDNVPISFSPPVSSVEQQALPLVVQSSTLPINQKPLDKFSEDYCEVNKIDY